MTRGAGAADRRADRRAPGRGYNLLTAGGRSLSVAHGAVKYDLTGAWQEVRGLGAYIALDVPGNRMFVTDFAGPIRRPEAPRGLPRGLPVPCGRPLT